MTPAPAASTVQYASDITIADVKAMRAFFDQHVEAPLISQAGQTERRFARALERAAWPHFYAAEKVFDVDDGSAAMLMARRQRWNELCRILEPWRDTEGYDLARWREVTFDNAQQATDQAAYVAKQKAESAAYYRDRL